MGKIRTIKPQFFQDEKVGRVTPLARYLFLGTFSLADDYGVFPGHPALVKARIFPYDADITIERVEEMLRDLESNGLLLKIVYRDEQYYIIRSFSDHQKIDRRYMTITIPPEIVKDAILRYEEQLCLENIPCKSKDCKGPDRDALEAPDKLMAPGPTPGHPPAIYTPPEVEACLTHDEVWLDSLCMNLHFDKNWVIAQVDEFLRQIKLEGRAYYGHRDIKRRFTAWIKEKTANNERARNDRTNDRASRRRIVAERAARRLSEREVDQFADPPF